MSRAAEAGPPRLCRIIPMLGVVSRPASLVLSSLLLAVLVAGGRADANVLRVCADPDNPPFTSSDPREPGLYLELAELLAGRLGLRMEPVFFRADAGRRVLRSTLLAGQCDAFFGLPHAPDGAAGKSVALSRPFLDVGYAIVAPKAFAFSTVGDLDGKRVGVQFASTPQTILSVRDPVRLVTFRSAEEAIDALGRDEIDAAFVWGPVAGYRAARLGLLDRFKIISVAGLDLRWQAAIGVRAADQALREHLDREVTLLGAEIATLARKYHVPMGRPIDLRGLVSADTSAEPAPPSPPGKVNPFRGDPAAAGEGRTQFNVHCSHCHSPNAANPEPRTDLRRLHRRYGDLVNNVFYTTIMEGRPTKGMPPWGEVLNEETIWKIKTFLESVQTTE